MREEERVKSLAKKIPEIYQKKNNKQMLIAKIPATDYLAMMMASL